MKTLRILSLFLLSVIPVLMALGLRRAMAGGIVQVAGTARFLASVLDVFLLVLLSVYLNELSARSHRAPSRDSINGENALWLLAGAIYVSIGWWILKFIWMPLPHLWLRNFYDWALLLICISAAWLPTFIYKERNDRAQRTHKPD